MAPGYELARRFHAVTLFGALVWRGGGWLPVLTATSVCATAAELLLPAALGHTAGAVLAADGTGDGRRWVALSVALVAILVCCRTLGDLAAGTAAAGATARLRRRSMPRALGIVVAAGGFAVAGDRVSAGDLLAAGQYALLAIGPGGWPGLLARLRR
jgi:uncharacterized RDD family membrane protein YckC